MNHTAWYPIDKRNQINNKEEIEAIVVAAISRFKRMRLDAILYKTTNRGVTKAISKNTYGSVSGPCFVKSSDVLTGFTIVKEAITRKL